ncbi:MAG: UDP-3-O-acyl-N-acetylglucosamine deacetylase, partial [Victivallaceae bacterium]
MEKQKTLAGSAFFSGIALHTGDRASVKMLPGEVNSGIIFRRVDLPGAPQVRALASNVVDVRRGTTIASGDARVYTVE